MINDNRLQVDDHYLWADVLTMPYRKSISTFERVSPEQLEQSLAIGRTAIHNAIETFYSKQYRELTPKGYTVIRPSIWVAQLGSSEQTDGKSSEVYTEKGYKNGGVHFDKDEQYEKFYPHWEAVEESGFVPHVRGSNGGAWLMLRSDDER